MRFTGSPNTSESVSVTNRPATRSREPATFDGAEVRPHQVEFFDARPRGAEEPRDGDLVGKRDARCWQRQQCRATAGEEANAQVVGLSAATSSIMRRAAASPAGRGSFTPTGRPAMSSMCWRGTSLPAGMERRPVSWGAVKTADRRSPAIDSSRPRAIAARFAGADDEKAADLAQIELQIFHQQPVAIHHHRFPYEPLRINRSDPCTPDSQSVITERHWSKKNEKRGRG